MKLKPVTAELTSFPEKILSFISGAKLFDSSCSPLAQVFFIEKDDGYFLKRSEKGALEKEAKLTRYFSLKGLAAEVLEYVSLEKDWLLTRKIKGEDCVAEKYLSQPKKLCDIFAQCLSLLHDTSYENCPVQNHTERYLARAKQNFFSGNYDKSHFPDSWGYKNAEEAFNVVETEGHLLQTNILLHGDYCLPNIILNNWAFSGFVDLDSGGVGDRHVDLFWALWTLKFNLKTDEFYERFIDVYGKEKVNEDMLRIVAALEVFG